MVLNSLISFSFLTALSGYTDMLTLAQVLLAKNVKTVLLNQKVWK